MIDGPFQPKMAVKGFESLLRTFQDQPGQFEIAQSMLPMQVRAVLAHLLLCF
jgi:hypothetical protein